MVGPDTHFGITLQETLRDYKVVNLRILLIKVDDSVLVHYRNRLGFFEDYFSEILALQDETPGNENLNLSIGS